MAGIRVHDLGTAARYQDDRDDAKSSDYNTLPAFVATTGRLVQFFAQMFVASLSI